MRHSRRSMLTCAGLALSAVLAGCASVHIHKVDAQGKLVPGAAEGLRFYLPRPYVSVFEPFIVASEVYLARGEVSADGEFLLLTEAPKALATVLPEAKASAGMGPMRIRTSQVIVQRNLEGGPHSDPPAPGAAASAPGQAASAPDKAASAPEKAASSPPPAQPLGGLLNLKATNDNAAFAITPQPRYFNLLWLPDFDEQYVIQAKAGLGNSAVVVGLGQGWSLQALDAKVDNSALTKPLLEYYGHTIQALQKLTTAKLGKGLPAGALAAPGGGEKQPHSGRDKAPTPTEVLAAGLRVTIKVTKVRVAAPGLYPILKPAELRDAKPDQGSDGRILKPVPPFTNIAFNTYDVIVVEAARASGDSALRVHQYVDSTARSGETTTGGDTPSNTPEDNSLSALESSINGELSKDGNVLKSGEAYEVKLDRKDGAIQVDVRKVAGLTRGTATRLPSQEVVRKLIRESLAPKGLVVSDAQVRFPETQ